MKKRRNKKRIIIAAVIVYLAVIGIVAVWESGRQKPANPDTAAAQEEAYNRKKAVIDAQEEAEQQAYDKAVQLLDYDVDGAAMKISPADCYSIMTANKLPALSRMAAEDSKKYMGNLQVLQKIEKLGIDTASFETPTSTGKMYTTGFQTQCRKKIHFQIKFPLQEAQLPS